MRPEKIIHIIETAIHWFIYGMVLFLFGREETIGKEVLDNANAIAVYASADATSEEVDLLRQRLRGGGVR